MAVSLITLTGVQLAFGHHALLDGADFTIQQGERIGLIGRNGAGKSSLLKILDGRLEPDDGEVMRMSGLTVATVEQEPELDPTANVLETLCGDYVEREDWQRPAVAGALIDQLGLQPDALVGTLSGGTRKRVALARALADQPHLLLLDEPTNHLDFDGILWLQQMLSETRCTVVVITHDRRFLDEVASRIVELDRGRLYSFPGNFSQWQARKAEMLEAEQQQQARFDKFLAQEEVWIRKGVEARRTRNEGRVRRLEQLRRERAERRERMGNVRMAVAEGARSGKLIAELENVSHSYGERVIVRNLSTTIMRRDRIGLIGPNGAGKTTLLRIILGELKPDSGTVRLGTQLTVGYFDQMRAGLDETATLADTISPGSEWVEIGGQRKHVMSYLEDFLFPPARSQSPVSSLSGGERARLALARMFARPTNVLVLDEPTNDLDIETLELLEDLLQDYSGTVLLVSHDRAFLDNVVTQTLVAEGNGVWREYPGGYDDWLAQRGPVAETAGGTTGGPAQGGTGKTAAVTQGDKAADTQADAGNTPARRRGGSSRLTNWEARELEGLPDKIAEIEAQQEALTAELGDPTLYQQNPERVAAINESLAELESQLEKLFERWELLEAKRAEQG